MVYRNDYLKFYDNMDQKKWCYVNIYAHPESVNFTDLVIFNICSIKK